MKRFNITVNGVTYDVCVEEAGSVASAPVAAAAPAAMPATGTKITAPMPGSVVDVCVSVGDSVKKGDKLVVLEAMKMENDIVAANDGTVTGVGVNKGDMVNAGDTLVVIG